MTDRAVWDSVDDYIDAAMVHEDEALRSALEAGQGAGMPAISVSPAQGKMLSILASLSGASAILEVGTLAGYSTIWLARSLPPGGRLVTLEVEPLHARVARANLERAGVSDLVDIRVGPALDSLAELEGEGARFDFAFVDADKPNNPAYARWVLRLAQPRCLLVVDNVVRDGAVADATSNDSSIRATREVLELLGSERGVSATTIQTVGLKGYDGFALALIGS